MMEKTNYIIHLNKAFEMICNDQRLTPFHVSLYFGLFQYWNIAKFRNPISISRDEMMRAAKIGSVNTYIRCIKELDAWQYIKYTPSFNPQKGSLVHLYNFDKPTNKPRNNGTDISSDNSTKKAADKTTKKQVRPSLNNPNSKNKKNKVKYANGNEPSRRKNSKNSSDVNGKRSATKKEFAAPGLGEIEQFFKQKKWPLLEAEKFFYHYSSNGWMVGKTPMHDWQAAAESWILKSEKFSWNKTTPALGNLHTTKDKNYSEPL